MKILRIVLLGLMITGGYAQDIKWKKLETLGYRSGFNFKKNVRYLKIVWKEKGEDHWLTIKKDSLDSFSAKTVKQFNNLNPKYSQKADIKYKGNAFFIDSKGKIWQMDMVKDVMSLMGDIDTPSEAQLAVWLHKGKNAKEYSKASKGYKLRVETYKNKKCYLDEIFVSKKGTLTSKRLKRGCQIIAKKKHIKNKYIKYETFNDIAIDTRENIYLLGAAIDTRSNNAIVATLDKYNKHGKKIWQRVIRNGYPTYAQKLALGKKYLYVIDSSSDYFIVQYSTGGKLISKKAYSGDDEKHFETIYKRSEKNKIKKVPYYRNRSKNVIYFVTQVISKSGNIYTVGREIVVDNSIPAGECGMSEDKGAMIVKFDKNGDQVWSKVIDLKW